MYLLDPIRNWYGKFERPISSLSLIAGFVFDALTLHRVDTLWENFWVIAHLAIVGTFIVLIHLKEANDGDEKDPSRAHFWFVNILQFFFGGLLSTFLVFYFRSADILITWPFIFLLVVAFVANESLKRHYIRLSFQISLFFLSIYSFAIFIVPVVLHKIGAWVFILSGLISLALIAGFLFILFRYKTTDFKESKNLIFGLIVGIFALVNVMYFTNLIPPIPLSLKDAGIYHSVLKNSASNYDVTYENYGWRGFFNLYPNFNEVAGDSVYAFSAIFSPKDLNIRIVHVWEHYDEAKKKWITQSQVNLPVIGGRDGGFRTYSRQSNLDSGRWQVIIKTERNQIIGHLRFNIVKTDIAPVLSSMVK